MQGKRKIAYGYGGNILRVDLTKRKVSIDKSPMGELRKFLGGAGYASKILYDEVPPEIEPFDPENRIIISTGLLSGTLAPCSGRFTLTTRSPLTGIFCDGNCGGFFGSELKMAGYDQVIIQGQSSSPVYLWIDDDQVEIRDASSLWGEDTWKTDRRIKEALGDESIQVGCIGPAGENLSFAACFITGRARAAARGGMGAVLGSKKLKAIAVRGSRGVRVANQSEHIKICKKIFDKILNDPGYMLVSTLGTGFLNDSFQQQHVLPYKYGFVDEFYWKDYHKHSQSEYQKNFWDHSMACFNCPIHCSHWGTVKEGPYRGTKGEGVEANTQIFFGSFMATDDLGFVAKCNNLCNQLGMGTDEVGSPIAYAMFLYGKGIISQEETGGLALTWNNQEVVLELIQQMAYNRGFGALLSQGTRKVAKRIGKGADYYAKNIKGLEVLADTRLGYAICLSFAVSTRGSDHLQGMSVADLYPREYVPEEILEEFRKTIGSPYKLLGPKNPSPSPYMVVYMNRLLAVFNCLELCVFPTRYLLFYTMTLNDLPPLLNTVIGEDFSVEALRKVGDRVRAVQRAFNARLGIRRKDDYPPEFTFKDSVKLGPLPASEFALNRKAYDEILTKYYELCGYDVETGIPTESTLEKLGLEEISNDLRKRGLLIS